MAERATSYLESKLNTVITVEKVDISFFKFFRFENLYIEDHQQDTLLFIETLHFGIDYFKFNEDTLNLHFGIIEVTSPYYNLSQNEGDSLTNLYSVIHTLTTNDTTASTLHISIKAKNLLVSNGKFTWNNYNFNKTNYGIDWDHVRLNSINAVLTNFEIANDTITSSINHLSGKDVSGFVLDDFTGEATFSATETAVKNLFILTPNSSIKVDLEYTYDSIGSYINFNRDVYMRYEIKPSIISVKDLSYFAPALEGLDNKLSIYGKERGPVSEMKFSNLFLKYGTNTVIDGRVYITGLPDVENTYFNCKFKRLSTDYTDLSTLKKYPFTENKKFELPTFLKNAGTVSFIGHYNGFYNNFVTSGTFKSINGTVTTDLQLSTNDSGDTRYRGSIQTNSFNLAQVVGTDALFNKASFNIYVEGHQLQFKEMSLKAKGTASRFDFKGYTYTDIKLDAGIKNETFSGLLSIADTNVNLEFNGSIALNEALPKYQFVASIAHLRPRQLNLFHTDSSASLSTVVNFNFEGNSLDNIVGHAGLSNFNYIENGESVVLNNVNFIALTDGIDKTIALSSDNINLQITGEFYFKELYQSLNYMTYKWIPSIYKTPQLKPESVQNFKLDLTANNFSGFSKIFVPQVSFNSDLVVHISYDSEIEYLNITSSASRMTFVDYNVDDFSVEVKITSDTFDLVSNGQKIYFTDSSYIENINIKSITSQNQISSIVDWNNADSEGDNSGNIAFDIRFIDPDNFDIVFYDSWIEINDTTWNIRDSSQILKEFKNYAFDNVLINHNNQDFSLNGFISEDPTLKLVVNVDSFNLIYLNQFLNRYNVQTNGYMDGSTVIQDFYGEFNLYSKLNFSNLVFNNQKIGSGIINSEWDDLAKKMDIKVDFEQDSLKPVSITGEYFPRRKTNQLDLSVELDQFPLAVIEPFFKGIVSEMSGFISGSAKVDGTVKEMLFNGNFVIHKASTHIDYLNEKVSIDNQKIFIRPNLIGADAVQISDSKNKKSELNFSLFHNNFEDVNFDLSITSIDVFRAFNTEKNDNDYFYGQIYLSPGSTIGLESDYNGDLNLTANVVSGPGTIVNIPFYDENEVAKKEYIYFKHLSSDSNINVTNEIVELEEEKSLKISMDMSIELTKNAEVQLLFDEFSSDKIKASGDGTINVKINDAGDFQMFGNYEIEDGYYLFTFSQIISKKFLIRKGSRLTWNGSPYEGVADIKATYKVRTAIYDLGPVVTAAYTDTSELKKRVPVEVVLTMTNNYMNPDLSFSFEMPPKYDEISALLNGLDEGERNKQVFGLLILNKFMPISGGGASTGANVVTTNGSEVLTNQLSSWLSGISNEFDVGISYNPGDQITGDEVEVALSTQVFNDRVLIETNFGMTNAVKGNATTTTQTNNFVGEFTISYKINEKGNIVGKVFQRSNELNPVYQNYSPYTQGVGIAYSEPFNNLDNLGCIMANHFRKKDKKLDCQAEYYAYQEAHRDDNQEKIQKIVENSRKKQRKRDQRKRKRQEKAANRTKAKTETTP